MTNNYLKMTIITNCLNLKFSKLSLMLLDKEMVGESIVLVLKGLLKITKNKYRLFKIHMMLIIKERLKVLSVLHKVHVQGMKDLLHQLIRLYKLHK